MLTTSSQKNQQQTKSTPKKPSALPTGTFTTPKTSSLTSLSKTPTSSNGNLSNVKSKVGSKENIKYTPAKGSVKIFDQKPDFSNVKSKVSSNENIKHTPGGGRVKIYNEKLEFKEKAQPKVGSTDNLSHTPGGGKVKIFNEKLAFKDNASPKIDAKLSQENSGANTPFF